MPCFSAEPAAPESEKPPAERRGAGPAPGLKAYVINLDSAPDRRAHMERLLAGTSLQMVRVPAIDGRALAFPHAEFAEGMFRWLHGRTRNAGEVGCYLSHLRALEAFLEDGAEHALICEDDLRLAEGAEQAVAGCLEHAEAWDLVRLSGLRPVPGLQVRRLAGVYGLRLNFGRLKGAGAYLVSRRAARRLLAALRPMRLPFDHAIDREWFQGLRALSLEPFPMLQKDNGFRSSIQTQSSRRLGWRHRLFGTWPYQAAHEFSRYVARGLQWCRLGRDRRSSEVVWRAPLAPAP